LQRGGIKVTDLDLDKRRPREHGTYWMSHPKYLYLGWAHGWVPRAVVSPELERAHDQAVANFNAYDSREHRDALDGLGNHASTVNRVLQAISPYDLMDDLPDDEPIVGGRTEVRPGVFKSQEDTMDDSFISLGADRWVLRSDIPKHLHKCMGGGVLIDRLDDERLGAVARSRAHAIPDSKIVKSSAKPTIRGGKVVCTYDPDQDYDDLLAAGLRAQADHVYSAVANEDRMFKSGLPRPLHNDRPLAVEDRPQIVDIGGVPIDLNKLPAEVQAEYDRAVARMNAAVDQVELRTAREAVARARTAVATTSAFNDALIRHIGAHDRRSA
jgi:hypothetical protein